MGDPSLDPTKPEVLLYIPTDQGPKLAGIEFAFGIGPPDSPVPDPALPAPALFGHTFDGPMEGHGLGQPPHYDLHLWLWQENPDGLFTGFNSRAELPWTITN